MTRDEARKLALWKLTERLDEPQPSDYKTDATRADGGSSTAAHQKVDVTFSH